MTYILYECDEYRFYPFLQSDRIYPIIIFTGIERILNSILGIGMKAQYA